MYNVRTVQCTQKNPDLTFKNKIRVVEEDMNIHNVLFSRIACCCNCFRLGVLVICNSSSNSKDYRKQCNSNSRDFWRKRITVIVIDKYSYVIVIAVSIKRF